MAGCRACEGKTGSHSIACRARFATTPVAGAPAAPQLAAAMPAAAALAARQPEADPAQEMLDECPDQIGVQEVVQDTVPETGAQ